MDCHQAQDAILDGFDETGSRSRQRDLDAHLAQCPACATFAATQQALDARLARMVRSPELSPAFRARLRQRIARDRGAWWVDVMPDVVHFVSCGLATLACAFLLQFDVSMILTAGTIFTLSTYLFLTMVRNTLEEIDRRDNGSGWVAPGWFHPR